MHTPEHAARSLGARRYRGLGRVQSSAPGLAEQNRRLSPSRKIIAALRGTFSVGRGAPRIGRAAEQRWLTPTGWYSLLEIGVGAPSLYVRFPLKNVDKWPVSCLT